MGDWEDQDRDQLERRLESELRKRGLTRRDLMRDGGMRIAAILGLGALFAACGGDGGGAVGDEETPGGAPAADAPGTPGAPVA
ncbi:MAG: hypothetical protein IT201_12185 [Thermoleophilia bacterium]|nr:hypothetical protein [Thermoleophilia bacterium]